MYLEKLKLEIEKYCKEENFNLIKAKKIILGDQKAIEGWLENTKIVEEEGKLDEGYYRRTVEGVLTNE